MKTEKSRIQKILIPLPSYGFDPTEAAIPWKILSENNFQIIFATPQGKKAEADRIMITGKGLGLFKQLLKAKKDAITAYKEMLVSIAFNNPIKYQDINEQDYDSIYLPGGHDKGVKEYLESTILQTVIPQFFLNNKKVGAICHGVILLARSKNPKTNKSVLYNYKTTSLLKSQELLAYTLTKLWLGNYYLTYPEKTVEEEVILALKNKNQFVLGPKPIFRDTMNNLKHGFVVRDKNYLSARWPGDIYSFTLAYVKMLNE